MGETQNKSLKIVIVEVDKDNLTLYSDYLSRKGYHVIARYTKADDIKTDLERLSPDIYIINPSLPGKTGTEVATEILDIYPSAPILFITADNSHPVEIKKHPKLCDKKVDVLLKPVKLEILEHTILNLVNK